METAASVEKNNLCRAHAALMEEIRLLEEAVSLKADDDLAEISDLLIGIRTHIEEHFRLEEENGYMDKVKKREPRLERAIENLLVEHRALSQSLIELIWETKLAPLDPSLYAQLQQRVLAWTQKVRQHEKRENELVQDAFDLDIGAED